MSAALMGSLFADESFHQWLAFAVLPLSIVKGLQASQERRAAVVTPGASGLLVLVFTAFAGHDSFGESGEKSPLSLALDDRNRTLQKL